MRGRPGRVAVPRRPDRHPRRPGEDHRRLGELVQPRAARPPPRAAAPGRGRRRALGHPGLTPDPPPGAAGLDTGPSRGAATRACGQARKNLARSPPRLRPPAPCQARLTRARQPAPPATTPGQVKSVQSRHWHLLVTRTQVCTAVGDVHHQRRVRRGFAGTTTPR